MGWRIDFVNYVFLSHYGAYGNLHGQVWQTNTRRMTMMLIVQAVIIRSMMIDDIIISGGVSHHDPASDSVAAIFVLLVLFVTMQDHDDIATFIIIGLMSTR